MAAEMEPITKLNRSVSGKVAFITGAASGMGRATAHAFADDGAKVAITDINAEGLDAVIAEIEADGGTAWGRPVDISDRAALESFINEAAAHFGGLDIVVNNAGIGAVGAIDDAGYNAAWDRGMAVMLNAQRNAIQIALPYLRKSSCARIVNIASTEGLGATPLDSPYSVAKHAVIGLTRALAVDLGREGITVNCICPGPIKTGMTAGISDEHKEIFAKRRVPLRRYGNPEEVAHMTLSLCLPAASYLNGVVIPVDGGMTIKNA
jgi:3-oxoacyl-[acyl-carrier protein] reductase